MFRDNETRLRQMLDTARVAQFFGQRRERGDLDNGRQLVLALIKAIETFGKAVSHVSVPTRRRLPKTPWECIIGMRNRLVHAYYDINLDIVWKRCERTWRS